MRHSRGMGDMNPKKLGRKMPKKITAKDDCECGMKKGGGVKGIDKLVKQTKYADRIGKPNKGFAEGGESKVNAAGNYTKPELRKRIVSAVKSSATQGTGAGQWSARKSQLVAKKYKAAGGGYK